MTDQRDQGAIDGRFTRKRRHRQLVDSRISSVLPRASERCHPGVTLSTPSTPSILGGGRATTPCASWYRRLVVLTTWILNRAESPSSRRDPAVSRSPLRVHEKAYRPTSTPWTRTLRSGDAGRRASACIRDAERYTASESRRERMEREWGRDAEGRGREGQARTMG